jgi:hypothetical protein
MNGINPRFYDLKEQKWDEKDIKKQKVRKY